MGVDVPQTRAIWTVSRPPKMERGEPTKGPESRGDKAALAGCCGKSAPTQPLSTCWRAAQPAQQRRVQTPSGPRRPRGTRHARAVVLGRGAPRQHRVEVRDRALPQRRLRPPHAARMDPGVQRRAREAPPTKPQSRRSRCPRAARPTAVRTVPSATAASPRSGAGSAGTAPTLSRGSGGAAVVDRGDSRPRRSRPCGDCRRRRRRAPPKPGGGDDSRRDVGASASACVRSDVVDSTEGRRRQGTFLVGARGRLRLRPAGTTTCYSEDRDTDG